MNILLYPTIDMRRTGKRIQQLCRLYGKSARILQQELGLASVQSVYDWFHGRTLPSLDNMCALSQLLGVSIEDLLVGRHGIPLAWRQRLPEYARRPLCYFTLYTEHVSREVYTAQSTNEVHEEGSYAIFPNHCILYFPFGILYQQQTQKSLR